MIGTFPIPKMVGERDQSSSAKESIEPYLLSARREDLEIDVESEGEVLVGRGGQEMGSVSYRRKSGRAQ